MMRTIALPLALALLAAAPAPQDDLAKNLLATWGAAADWLVGQQDPSTGAWMMGPPGKANPSPAYTALIVTSLANAPESVRPKYQATVDKAVGFLLSKANKDGSFGEGPTGNFMKTYTTALALQALGSVDQKKHAEVIRGAHAYLKSNQMKEGVMRGGMGYGDEKPKVDESGKPVVVRETVANLSVLGFSADGMMMSGLPKEDEFWKLAIEFVKRCQNNSETNTDPAFMAALKEKGLSIGNDGGLFYAPVADPAASKAGIVKIADKQTIASYGSMTYDGVKTLIYAGMDKKDPVLVAAMGWVRKNYSVDVHPGFAFDARQRHHLRGLYHYYLVMARALHAWGENPLETFDGKRRDWPREMAERLARSVKDSKMWINENAAWYEGDPVLVTSYVLSTCDILFQYVK